MIEIWLIGERRLIDEWKWSIDEWKMIDWWLKDDWLFYRWLMDAL